MILSRITARNFRNLADTPIDFHPETNLIVGRNGHKSVFSGLIVGGIEPVFVAPAFDDEHDVTHAASTLRSSTLARRCWYSPGTPARRGRESPP